MKLRCTASAIFALAMVVLGCSAGGADSPGSGQSAATCTPGEVSSCACTDGTTGSQTCNTSGGFDPCTCAAGGSTSSGGGGIVSSGGVIGTSGAGGTAGGTFGTGGVIASGGVVGTGGVVASGGFVSSGGTLGTGGIVETGGVVGTGGDPVQGTGGGPIQTAKDPVIPPVTGACPNFVTGTQNFMSLQGINMQVGPKSNGGGYLLFYWHGTGSSAGEVGFVPQAAQQTILNSGGIIISPQSSTGTTNGLTASGTSIWFDEDLTTADEIVACAVRDYGIDPHRIYSTGCSAGGLMAGHMAWQRWQYIASVATNSGGALGASFTGLGYVPPVLTMHGSYDADYVVLHFSDSSIQFDQAVVSAGGFAVDCDHGGGHCGAPADLYASAMTFMFDHPYGASPEPYAGGLPPGFPSYCAIQ